MILSILTILEGHIHLLRGNQVSVTYMGHVHMTHKYFAVKKLRDEHKNQHPRDSRTQSSQPVKKRRDSDLAKRAVKMKIKTE